MRKDSSEQYCLPLEQELRRDYNNELFDKEELELGEAELDLFGRFLRKMLVIDPKHRAKSEDLLADPWVSEVE